MTTITGSERGGIVTEWRRSLNRFGGCLSAGCELAGGCMADQMFSGCPIGAECFTGSTASGKNTLAVNFLNKLADDIAGVTNALSLSATRIACTTITGAPSEPFTVLPSELYRDAFVDRQRPSDGKTAFYWYFGPSVAIGNIERWAIMAGSPSAHPTSDGQALNHWPDSIAKTGTDTATGQYSILFAGA